MLLPLLPLVSPGVGESAQNLPSELLRKMKGYVFAQVNLYILNFENSSGYFVSSFT